MRTVRMVLVVVCAFFAGMAADCESGEYTIRVDRQEDLFVAAGSYTGYRHAIEGDNDIKVEFRVLEGGGPVDFLVLSDDDLALWESGQAYDVVLETRDRTSGELYGTVASDGDYWVIVSNRDDAVESRRVTYDVWRRPR